MKASQKLLNRKAISPLIATIILIAICVVGGLLVYSVFMSTSSTLGAKGQISVESADLVMDTDGNAVFSITVKNTGNKPAYSLTVTLGDEDEADVQVAGDIVSSTNPLQPGQSAILINNDLQEEYIVGNSYNVVIQAEFSDGSMFIKTEAVTCRYS